MIKLFELVLICIVSRTITSTISNKYSGFEADDSNEDDETDYALDLAIKLKRDYADDLVSELFATSHGLEKIARVSDLDNEQRLFHFKLNNLLFDSDNMNPVQIATKWDENLVRKKRTKRHIYNKIEVLRQDDRVEYVYPQRYLSRHKRSLNREILSIDEIDQILNDLNKELDKNENKKANKRVNKDDLDLKLIEESLERLFEKNEKSVEKRKKMQDHFDKEILRQIDFEQIKLPKLEKEIDFNDENYKQQWYLINEGQFKIPLTHDLNVKQAWLKGYTGKNVTIVIVDDGLDHEHPDFQGKYRADLSYDYNDENDTEHDPMPSTFDNENNHGTRCAGAAAANANNSVCGVGVAYDAQIAGIRILDGPITDLLEARALSYKAKEVDIKSASWGPKDDGAHMEYPGRFVNLALEEGVKNGRNGKGTLYIWASGNGGGNEDDCSCDGYVSNWNIISIGSINHRGLKPYFMELCPSTMAVVYSGGQSELGKSDDDPGVRVVTSDVRGKCTTTFQGTSSAAPLAAGALALVLEANPDLTYRDVMYLIAKTSRIPNIEDTDGWIINGANYHVNEKYGFGVLDISQMIQEAQTWRNVPERQKCVVEYQDELPNIGSNDKIVLNLNVDNCENVDILEHVVANVSFTYSVRGDLKLTLVSPHGTPSEILSFRKNDKNSKVFNWGESSVGKWKLIIESRTKENAMPNSGKIEYFSLVLYGIKKDKNTQVKKRFAEQIKAYIPTPEHVKRIYNIELKLSRKTRIVHKRVFEANPELKDVLRSSEDDSNN